LKDFFPPAAAIFINDVVEDLNEGVFSWRLLIFSNWHSKVVNLSGFRSQKGEDAAHRHSMVMNS